MAPTDAGYRQAIDDLTNQTRPNVAQASREQDLHYQTLNRRFRHGSQSIQEFHRDYQCLLTRVQEDSLIGWISEMSRRKLPPTPQMMRSFVERVVGHEIGPNWVTRFLVRRSETVISKWLPGLDAKRVGAEANRRCYEIWYNKVSSCHGVGSKAADKAS
ncbi:MAG TPA: hypothetical protein VHV10_18255 [Ktedonobacteraceae bacterium]|jgi:hypothetical protein|nr:hypothetical protein [Ktedonobacteraceae bacterium]